MTAQSAKMSMKKNTNDDFSSSFKALQQSGMWYETKSPLKRTLLNIYNYFIIFAYFYSIIFQSFVLLEAESYHQFSFNLSFTSVYIIILSNTCGLNLKRNKLASLKEFMKVKPPIELTLQETQKFVNQSRLVAKAGKLFYYWTMMSAILFSITPFLMSKPRQVPIPAKFPYDWQATPYYELTYAFEVYLMYYIVVIIIWYDFVVFGIMVQICVHYEVLRGRIKWMQYGFTPTDAELDLMSPDDERLSYPNRRERIARFVEYHQLIIEYVNQINDIQNMNLLTRFTISTIYFCGIGLDFVIMNDGFDGNSFGEIVETVTAIFDLMIHCILGNRIKVASEDFADALYDSEWYTMETEFQKDVMLMMGRCQKPPVMTVGKFYILDNNTYLQLMINSYNWLALFHSIAST